MERKSPTISVVMPVYNAERHLKKSIQSILNQTYEDFEFIIIDDGSKDSSWSIIENLATLDSRIIALQQENQGVVKTANRAMREANGKYIARTDADDISFDTKLEDLVLTALKYPDADVIAGSIEVIDESDEFLYRSLTPVFDDDIKRSLYIRNPIPNGATLIKRQTLIDAGGFADVFAEDCHLWARLWHKSKFRGTGTIVYRWRVNPTGLTMSNNEKSIAKEKEYLTPLWNVSPPQNLSRSEIIKRAHNYLNIGGRFPIDYKVSFMFDLSRVAVHQIKHGHIKAGIAQLLSLASTGRTGLKIVIRRVLLASKGARSQMKNKT